MNSTSAQQLTPGQKFASFVIVRKIGEGGMGEVYEAWEESLQRKVAIKILSSDSLPSREMQERFHGEGRALAKIDHRNVVSLFSIGDFDGRTYMVMEYVDGLSVKEFFERHSCDLRNMLGLFKQMADGLAAAHEVNVIHRDIKPANIIIDHSLSCKIIDFGIAKVHSDHHSVHTAKDIVMGTANFLSPEVVMGRASTPLSDIYSLGLVFYSILTGEIPFQGHSNLETLEKIRSSALTFDPRFNIILPEEVRHIVFRMTSKSPAMRYQNAGDVATALAAVKLENWPGDLIAPVDSRSVVENRAEVQSRCESQGFALPEIRLIINLALSLESNGTTHAAASVRLNQPAIAEAIERFNSAKAELTARRRALSHLAQATPKTGPRLKFMWPAMGCLALFTIYFTHALQKMPGILNPRESIHTAELSSSADQRRSSVERPVYNAGDAFQFGARMKNGDAVRDFGVRAWTFASSTNGRTLWIGDEEAEFLQDDEFYFPPYRTRGLRFLPDMTLEKVAGGPSLFPFRPNAVSRDKFKVNGREFIWRCRLGEQGPRTVVAGTFETFRVDCGADKGPFESATFFYAPKVRHWVQAQIKLRAVSSPATFELFGYQSSSKPD